MNTNPREETWQLVRERRKEELLERAAVLHGHYCPGLALGVAGAIDAVNRMEAKHQGMEEILAVVETNNCSSDGIQFITGCTFGNNSLIFKDIGKTAFSLLNRDGEGYRYVVKNELNRSWQDEIPEYEEVFTKVVTERRGTQEDRKKLSELSTKASYVTVITPVDELFYIEKVEVDIPEYAPIYESCVCTRCGEKYMASRGVEIQGEDYCIGCAGKGYYRLTGFGIERAGSD
ncbi:MAG: FmdE family protein [Thermoplasmata archaeon]